MDSVKSFKGYGKVNEAEDIAFRRKARKRIILLALGAVVLVVVIVAVSIALSKRRRDNGSSPSRSSSTTATASIKALCSVTLYPDSCFSSISDAKGANVTSDPEELFKLSVEVAMGAISTVSSVADGFTIPGGDKRLQLAVSDCKELLSDALDRLNDSLTSLQPAPGELLLSESKIEDLRTWLSGVVTDQETCLDGFEGTTGNFREKLEAAMVNSTRFASNSLAIATKILSIMKKLDFRIHRKLLSVVSRGAARRLHWAYATPQRRAFLQGTGPVPTPNVTVAADGSGQVRTIKEAVALVPAKNAVPFVIYVKEGVYRENVEVYRSKWNVVLIGDGMYKSVVEGSRNFVDGTPTFSTATFVASGKNFMARDMGFKNSAGAVKHQAVAFRSSADHSVFYRCSFDAFQDTLYAHSFRQFYRDCDIIGTIDFIFGDSAVVFQNCNILPREALPGQQNTITAQGKKDPNENTGISVQGCSVKPYGTVTVPTYLGRPWKDYSTTVFMQSEIGDIVDQAGWTPWVPGTEPPSTINYAEYQNTGPGSGVAGRVMWAGYNPSLSAETAAKYTVESFLDGGGWIPPTGVQFQLNLGQ